MYGRTVVRLGAPVLLVALVSGACSSSGSKTTSTTGAAAATSITTTTVAPLAPATLNGSGSTLQANFDNAAIEAFNKIQPKVTINYNATGSGQGQTDLEGQVVDFAGSDVPIPATDTAKLKGGPVLYFPTVASPITVAYNLPGVSSLSLSPSTLAKIFSRTVKTWNAPAIAADNPGATLPSKDITIVHRTDGSGTTANFTKFLVKAGGTDWTLGTGKTVNWSTDSQGGKGNPGVVNVVKSTEGAVGYIDFSDAKAAGLSFASIKNAAGKFIAPSLDSASAAIASATMQANLLYDPINASGDAAYPVTSPTYVIVYAKQTDAAKGAALKAFLSFAETDGQALAANVQFAKLSSDLASKAAAQVAQITVG